MEKISKSCFGDYVGGNKGCHIIYSTKITQGIGGGVRGGGEGGEKEEETKKR